MNDNDIIQLANEKIFQRLRNLVDIQGEMIVPVHDNSDDIQKLFLGFGEFISELAVMMENDKSFQDIFADNPNVLNKLKKLNEKDIWDIDAKAEGNLRKAIGDMSELLNISTCEKLFILPSIKKGISVDEVLVEIKKHGSLLGYYDYYFTDIKNINHTTSFWENKDFFKGSTSFNKFFLIS
jgi:hypothetical protein